MYCINYMMLYTEPYGPPFFNLHTYIVPYIQLRSVKLSPLLPTQPLPRCGGVSTAATLSRPAQVRDTVTKQNLSRKCFRQNRENRNWILRYITVDAEEAERRRQQTGLVSCAGSWLGIYFAMCKLWGRQRRQHCRLLTGTPGPNQGSCLI